MANRSGTNSPTILISLPRLDFFFFFFNTCPTLPLTANNPNQLFCPKLPPSMFLNNTPSNPRASSTKHTSNATYHKCPPNTLHPPSNDRAPFCGKHCLSRPHHPNPPPVAICSSTHQWKNTGTKHAKRFWKTRPTTVLASIRSIPFMG